MSKEELKPCPFCSGEATIYNNLIECLNYKCPSNPQVLCYTLGKSIKAWNTRAKE